MHIGACTDRVFVRDDDEDIWQILNWYDCNDDLFQFRVCEWDGNKLRLEKKSRSRNVMIANKGDALHIDLQELFGNCQPVWRLKSCRWHQVVHGFRVVHCPPPHSRRRVALYLGTHRNGACASYGQTPTKNKQTKKDRICQQGNKFHSYILNEKKWRRKEVCVCH